MMSEALRRIALSGLLCALSWAGPPAAAPLAAPVPQIAPAPLAGTVTQAEWDLWKSVFLEPDGRVVDALSGNVSHSEGQGYGMLLAVSAGQRADFERIWAFTRVNMALRDDGLVAWRWEPDADPHVTDANNATDGDILIAYALLLAGAQWQDPALVKEGSGLVRAIRAAAVRDIGGQRVIMPGAAGFSASDRPDGPVVNPSYWIFEALPLFAAVDPEGGWRRVEASGLALVEAALSGDAALPADWLSLAPPPHPADGFDPVFGYNAFRIPLYLLRAGLPVPSILERFRSEAVMADGRLGIRNLETGAFEDSPSDPGYRAIAEMMRCAADGSRISGDVREFRPTSYFPSTLHLLVLSHIRKEFAQCL